MLDSCMSMCAAAPCFFFSSSLPGRRSHVFDLHGRDKLLALRVRFQVFRPPFTYATISFSSFSINFENRNDNSIGTCPINFSLAA